MNKKVYFPVESLVGLGHFNRSGKIAREMIKSGLDVTVASGSFVDRARFFAGTTCREIPPLIRNEHGVHVWLDPAGNRHILEKFNAESRQTERIAAQLGNINALNPDVLISEFWPFSRPGVDQEMESMLEAVKGLKLISVRDVLDTPDEALQTPRSIQAHADREAWIVKTINEKFDAVLVHGDPNFVPLRDTFASADKIRIPIIYTGYVVDEMPKRTIALDDPAAPIIVSCGSGVEGEQMVFSFLTAWQKLLVQRASDPAIANLTNRPVRIICGPRFNPEAFKEVSAWTKELVEQSGQTMEVDHYRDDFTSLMASAAFSVSLAGYNTTLETLAMKTPALLVPKYSLAGPGHLKISTEQLYRLERLAEEGIASYAHPHDVQDGKKFAAILLREFTRQTTAVKPQATLDFSGAANTITAIDDLLRSAEKKVFPVPAYALA